MALLDIAAGSILVLVGAAVFAYYATWTVVLPFLSLDHFLRQFFLPGRQWVFIVPLSVLVGALAAIGAFFIHTQAKKKKKKQKST